MVIITQYPIRASIDDISTTGAKHLLGILLKSFENDFAQHERELHRLSGEVTQEILLASERAAKQERDLQAIDRQQAKTYRKAGLLFRIRVDAANDNASDWRYQVRQRETSE